VDVLWLAAMPTCSEQWAELAVISCGAGALGRSMRVALSAEIQTDNVDAGGKWMLTSEDVRHYIDERYRRLPCRPSVRRVHSHTAAVRRDPTGGDVGRPPRKVGPAGAAIERPVASGNYWTPRGPPHGPAHRDAGRSASRDDPSGNSAPSRRRLIVNSNTFSFRRAAVVVVGP